MTKNHHKSWKSPEICKKSCFPSTRADPSRPRRENINNPIGILRFREPSQRLMKWKLQWKSRIFVKSVEFHGISWKSIEFHENVWIHDFSENPDFQWNAPQKHQEMVTFIKGSGVGPGEARFAQKLWRSTKCMPLQQKTRRTYCLSCFHEDLVLFASSARNHGIPRGLLRFLRCHFLQNHHLHGNHDFLWKSQISMKITEFPQKPRFSRKCWFRRKARLENTKKRLRL